MKLIKNYENENGNTALFVIAALSMLMVLFVFVFNMGSALFTKEQSFTVAKQASLAASSSLYDQVRSSLTGLIITYGEDPENQQTWSFDEEWDGRIGRCTGNDSYNECQVEVLEEIVNAALGVPLLGDILKGRLSTSVNESHIISAAKQAITSNGGTTDGAELMIRDNRFKVRAAAVFNSISYDDDYLENKGEKYLDGISKNIYRDSQGPKIAFLEEIINTGSYSLE
ncbi:Tad domain-containing protein [Ornithinibacillus scapharcae]|uniref:Tad domain-containing protein n=1 Tax=Ornithinibacillus scapharcae TaxID=1147159 RepID=UPI000225B3F8|nr:Tad domain-containing protein [Ornithinibacillus scapharcae]